MSVVSDDSLPAWWYEQLSALGDCTPEPGMRPESVAGRTRLASAGIEGFITLDGLIDVEAERPRIEKKLASIKQGIAASSGKLANANFRDRAPAAVVQQEEERLAELEAELVEQERLLAELG